MKIIVLMKQVPDTYGERQLEPSGLLDRGASDPIIDEISELSLECALTHKDGDKSTEVTVLSMGPATTKDSLRKALSMGADAAIHVLDDELAGADLVRTARVLAAALRGQQFDLIIAGNETTDGRGGVVPAMLAELLGLPLVGSLDSVNLDTVNLDTVNLDTGTVKGVRATEHGTMDVHADLPAIISVTERMPEARFPSLKGIMTAKRKPFTAIGVAELGADAAPDAGAARSTILTVAERPARSAGTKLVDDGTAATQLADYLAAGQLI